MSISCHLAPRLSSQKKMNGGGAPMKGGSRAFRVTSRHIGSQGWHRRTTRSLNLLAGTLISRVKSTQRSTKPDCCLLQKHSVRWRLAGSAIAACCIAAALSPQRSAAATFPPKANAAWVYDPPASHGKHGPVIAGYFANAIAKFNKQAPPGGQIGELYVYGGDMEMYCPNHRAAQCVPSDFHVYLSKATRQPSTGTPRSLGSGDTSVQAYAKRFAPAKGHRPLMQIAMTIDGVTSKRRGALRGFNSLSRNQAAAFAAKVARRVCTDNAVGGVEFDLEPLTVSRKSGQFYFYTSIAKDFASEKMGCVDRKYPHGRFFSIFTVANRIAPHTASARHVGEIMHTANNGYLIDALYDLSSTPPGHQTPLATYKRLVQREVRRMRRWSSRIGVKYQLGLPAAASAHEFAMCRGPRCHLASNMLRKDNKDMQLAYIKADVAAIRDNNVQSDPGFLGISLWAWSPGLHYKNMHIFPSKPPPSVERYLSEAFSGKP